MRLFVPLAALALAAGCNPKPGGDFDAMVKKNEELEARVAELESKMDRVAEIVQLPAAPEREEEAMKLADEVRTAMDAMEMEKARDGLKKLVEEYGDTTVGRSAVDISKQYDVIGADASLPVSTWVQGEHTMNPEHTTLLVFFEAWCPHCQREVPNVQKTWTDLKGQGLDVVGVTSFSRGTTDEQMSEFLTTGSVGFPVAKDDGTLWGQYGAEGVPYAVIAKGGKVTWVGHPGNLDEATLSKLMSM